MSRKITDEYVTEKIEAYTIAIMALRGHEPASDCSLELTSKLREKLAQKLDNECQRWYNKMAKQKGTSV